MKVTLIANVVFIAGCTGINSIVSGIPSDARYCAVSSCNHNYNSSLNNISDNAYRGTRGSIVRSAGTLAEGTTEVILTPILNMLKPEDNTPSLEKIYLQNH